MYSLSPWEIPERSSYRRSADSSNSERMPKSLPLSLSLFRPPQSCQSYSSRNQLANPNQRTLRPAWNAVSTPGQPETSTILSSREDASRNVSQRLDVNLARTFSDLMLRGKTSAALDLLSQKGKGGVLRAADPANPDDPASPTVLEVLKSKHPHAQPATTEALLPDLDPTQVHPVIYDMIKSA